MNLKRLCASAVAACLFAGQVQAGVINPPVSPAFVQNHARPGVTNYASIVNGGNNYANWRKCREYARTAAAKCSILFIGDSTTAGYLLGNQGATKTWPMRIAVGLSAQPLPIPATQSTFFGEGQVGTSAAPVSTAMTYGTGWSTPNVANALGGNWPMNSSSTSGTANALAFAFTQSNDTCDIWYPLGPGGSFTYQVDAGAASASISEVGTSNLVKQTVSLGTAGAHTLYINRVSGSVYIAGVNCYNSASPAVSIFNGAVSSQNSSYFNNSAFGYNALPAIGKLGESLTIIDLGINDWGGASGGTAQQTVSQFTTNMQALITAAVNANSDVILVVPPASNPSAAGGGTSYAVQAQYVSAIYSLAQTNHLMVIDMQQHWGNYTQFAGAGFNADNVVHPNLYAHMDMGAWIAQVLAGL